MIDLLFATIIKVVNSVIGWVDKIINKGEGINTKWIVYIILGFFATKIFKINLKLSK